MRRRRTCSPIISTMSADSRTRSTVSWEITNTPPRPASLESCHCNPRSALVPRRQAKSLHPCVLAEHLSHALAQCTRSLSMDDPDVLHVSTHCSINCLKHDTLHFVCPHPPNIQFTRNIFIRKVAANPHRLNRGRIGGGERLQRYREFHDSNRHHRVLLTKLQHLAGGSANGPHLYGVSDRYRPEGRPATLLSAAGVQPLDGLLLR